MPQQIVTNGTVTLPQAYSYITIGLPFTCQLQTPYLDPPGPTTQGDRKDVYSAIIRVNNTRGFSVGTNQVDASTQPNNAIQDWPLATQTSPGMSEIKEGGASVNLGSAIPLFTGDIFKNVFGSWADQAQVAIQQTYPLSCNVDSILTRFQVGDTKG